MTDIENEGLREALADQEHERWSRWMKYLFGKCRRGKRDLGSLVIPGDSVRHWQRQIDTPYADLSEREKDSGRKEADLTIATMQAHQQTRIAAEVDFELDYERFYNEKMECGHPRGVFYEPPGTAGAVRNCAWCESLTEATKEEVT